jgi:ribosomal protein S18 acetylase RimI-like enzyme
LDTISNPTNIAQSISFDVHQIAVRAVQEDEIQYVADIITRSFHFDRGWKAWFTPLFRIGIAEDLRHRLRACAASSLRNKPQQQICSIALYGNIGQTQVVGTIEVGVRTAHDRPHPYRYVYISNLAVSRDFRRRGVARELLSHCEQLCKSWGYSELYLHVMSDNHRGLSLYHKIGYEVVSTELVWSWFPWWHRPERISMCKKLSG